VYYLACPLGGLPARYRLHEGLDRRGRLRGEHEQAARVIPAEGMAFKEREHGGLERPSRPASVEDYMRGILIGGGEMLDQPRSGLRH